MNSKEFYAAMFEYTMSYRRRKTPVYRRGKCTIVLFFSQNPLIPPVRLCNLQHYATSHKKEKEGDRERKEDMSQIATIEVGFEVNV